MSRGRASLGDQRGMALVMALVMLVVVTGLVLAFMSVSAFEPQISQNMAVTAQARMVADAGIEWAFNRLATLPAGQSYDQYWDAILAAGGNLSGGSMPIPGLTGASGTFTVTVRNDVAPADREVTGVVPDPAVTPPRDANGRVILSSTGAIAGPAGVSKTVLAVIRRTAIPPINGALAFPGSRIDANFAGSAFDIRGTDHNLDGTPGPRPAVFGISVSGDPAHAGHEAVIEDALHNHPRNQVQGRSESTGLPTSGVDAVRADASLTAQQVADFVAALKTSADVTLSTAAGRTFAARDLGATCGATWASPDCWGTAGRPKIVHVKGDPSAAYTSVDVSGQSAGAGILIVENGRLEVAGDFRWDGPIVVIGNHAGIRFKGAGHQEVYGALIVSATGPAGSSTLEGDAPGGPKILYSSQALALIQARMGRRLMTMYSWRER